MDRIFVNRADKSRPPHANEPAVPGLWMLTTNAGGVFLNSVPAQDRHYLIPGTRPAWAVITGTGTVFDGAFFASQLPAELEAEAVRAIGTYLESRGGWLDWCDASPLVQQMSKSLELEPLEKIVRDQLGHLERVCRKPRAHLHSEIERVMVSRARRIPQQAANYLAAHTEDWLKPQIRTVIPKRVLSETHFDLVNIYENRVVARLIDHLLGYLNRRISQVRKLLLVMADAQNYSEKVRGTHWLQKRISTLWGQAAEGNEARRLGETTLKVLERLRYSLLGARGSRLYEEIPRRATVPKTLKMTNILSNDTDYRQVARLWREWSRQSSRPQTPNEVYDAHQQICLCFERFCALLLVRALDQLGYAPDNDDDTALDRGSQFHFGPLVVSWTAEGTFQFHRHNELVFCLIPLPATLAADRWGESLDRVIGQLTSGYKPRSSPPTVFLYLGSDNPQGKAGMEGSSRLNTVGNDPGAGLPAGFGLIPVSPYELLSVERVARAIRWALCSQAFLAYPPKVPRPPDAMNTWIRPHESERAVWAILQPPRDSEQPELLLTADIERLEGELQRKDEERILADRALHKARQNNESSHAAQTRKKELARDIVGIEQELEGLRIFKDALTLALPQLLDLCRCPMCREVAAFKARDGQRFRCDCPGCESRWGLRSCSKCGNRYPFFLPGQARQPDEVSADWVERQLGMDVLAIPLPSLESHLCPECPPQ